MKTFSITHQGRVRPDNQDQYLVKEFQNGTILLAVFDGLGGEAAGQQAAEIAKESLDDFNPYARAIERHLIALMELANQKILDAVDQYPDQEGMATTMTVAFLRNGVVNWAHVGDSRLYLFHKGKAKLITEDDTIPGLLLSDGDITKEEARVHPMKNMLFECLGRTQFEAHAGSFKVEEGDTLLLSTDGLHDEVSEERMVSILLSNEELGEKFQALVSAALDEGGRDNITVVGAEM